MKLSARLVLIVLLALLVAIPAHAGKKDRRLSVGAYLSSAKIEIVSGDLERYETAITYLDSLFINYGPHAEGLKLMGQIMVDFIAQAPSPQEKQPYLKKLVAYNDSLHMCCANDKIDKKFRKNCDEFIQLSDSTKVAYWREFYNAGIEQLKQMTDIQGEMAAESDSAAKEMLTSDLKATLDTCVTYMEMAILLDANAAKPYVGIGSAYEKVGDYEKAIEWLDQGLQRATQEDQSNLLFSLAYNYIQLNDFCKAIPYFKRYVEIHTEDTSTMYNLAACYNNCKFYDSAAFVNQQILALAPNNLDALISVGYYHNQRARDASDSVRYFQGLQNKEQIDYYTTKRVDAFDSSKVYFERATEAYPEDIQALEQLGTVTAILEQYDEAATAFAKLTELVPQHAEYWRSLGDFNLRLKKFDDAIVAYEKTVEIQSSDVETWERLSSLYHEKGMTAKEQEASKQVKNLRGGQ